MSDIEPAVELFVERRLGESRAELRGELATAVTRLEESARVAALQSSQEHAEVRGDLTTLTGAVAGLKASVDTLMPLVPAVAALQIEDVRDQAKADAKDELLRGLRDARRYVIGTGIALAGVVVGALALFT